MNSIQEDPKTEKGEFNLLDLFQLFRRRSLLFWGIVAGSLALAIIVCIVSTRKYEASGTIQIGKEASDALGLESLMGGMGGADPGDALTANINIATQANILQSDTLALETINGLQLEKTYDFQPHFTAKLINWLTGWMSPAGPKDPVNAKLEDSPQRRSRVLKTFSKNLTVKPVAGTRLIEIHYLSSNPRIASDVVNSLNQGLIEYTFRTKFDATAKASDWLSAQMEGLRRRSEELQSQVVQMQKDSGVYSIGTTDAAGREQAYSGVLDRLQQDTVALTAAIQNRVLKGAVYQAAKSGDAEMLSGLAGNGVSTGGLSSGINNSLTVIQGLRQQEGILNGQIQQDTAKYGSAYPRLEQERANFAGLEKAIHDESVRLADRAKSDADIAAATEEATRKEYETQRASADSLNDKAIKYVIAREEAIDSRTLYADLMKRLKEAGVLQGLQSTNITVVDNASVPAKPKWPNIPLYMVVAFCWGLCFGGVVIMVVDNLDNKIQEPGEIERLGFSLFGIIPKFDGFSKPGELQVLVAPRSPYSESIRNLCSSLMLAKSGDHPKTILVTSAIPGEGKSTLSANLATNFAQQGKRVLLVEADMRRPAAGRLMGITSKTGGLSSLLSSSSTTSSPVEMSEGPPISVLAGGALPPYPAELLGSARMKQLVLEWRDKYDIVVLDGPPVLPVVDALILSELADATIQVVRHNMTTRTSLRRANRLLQTHSKGSIGVALNAVSSRSSAYYGYYGYKQSEYYGSDANHENN